MSCGRDNIRLWRIRNGVLRSCPINLVSFHRAGVSFTAVAFYRGGKDAEGRVFVSSSAGDVFEVSVDDVSPNNLVLLVTLANCFLPRVFRGSLCGGFLTSVVVQVQLRAVHHLHDAPVHSIHINGGYCVTAGGDKMLRAWPLTFAEAFLEAEHEGAVQSVRVSADGSRIAGGTSSGSVGVLDVSSRAYNTVMRSHVKAVSDIVLDEKMGQFATVSEDETIRVWDSNT